MTSGQDGQIKPASGLEADIASAASQAGPPPADPAPLPASNRSRRAGDRAVPPKPRDPDAAPTWWLESRAEIARQELERAAELASAPKADKN